MKKIIKIKFSGQAKGVVAESSIEYEQEGEKVSLINGDILLEAKELYKEANEYAETLTKLKMR